VAAKLERWALAGIRRPLSAKEVEVVPCTSPAFVSWVWPKPWLFIDVRPVNEQLQTIQFNYEESVEIMAAV